MKQKPKSMISRNSPNIEEFQNLNYEKFRKLAIRTELSTTEKVGFPDDYRKGRDNAMLADVCAKLTNISRRGIRFLDIGPGCSAFSKKLISAVRRRGARIHLIDSPEMLRALNVGGRGVDWVVGRFPEDAEKTVKRLSGKCDCVLCYSVLHYIFAEGNLFSFVDKAVSLLAPGGQLLLGDIPSAGKRRRFFSSVAGRKFHRKYTGKKEEPVVNFNILEQGQIDDACLMGLILRYRAAGYDAYILPQGSELPMANRREDLLIVRP